MSLLFYMSLSGTIVMAAYYFMQILFNGRRKTNITPIWSYRFLKLALIFYLLPFQPFKFWLADIIKFILPVNQQTVNHGYRKYSIFHTMQMDGKMGFVFHPSKPLIAIMAIWFIGILIFVVKRVTEYFVLKRNVLLFARKLDEEEVRKTFAISAIDDQRKRAEEIYHKRKVRVVISSLVDSPMTIGIFRPVIIMPDKEIDEKNKLYIYCHELTHIRQHDILIKFICLLAVTLHWFNPITLLLMREINIICEYACDERLTEGMDRKDISYYGGLLIMMATSAKDWKPIEKYSGSFSRGNNVIKKRILLLSGEKKMRKFKRGMSLVLFVTVTMLAATTAFAYEPPKTLNADEYVEYNEATTFDFAAKEDVEVKKDNAVASNNEEIIKTFVDEEGIAHVVKGGNINARSICFHNYQSGYMNVHNKYSNGSCKTDVYRAECCSKCGDAILHEIVNTITCTVCPH